jgi:glycine/D-amino acid oxidase-like deaminating enzyme
MSMRPHQQKQEHAKSYYAATANDPTVYPELTGAVQADVCVVGGGFTGVSAALSLAERGYSVALLEGNRISWGASGRNGGQIISGGLGMAKIAQKHGDGVADMLWDMKWRGVSLIRDRIAKYNIECDLKNGYMEVATKPRQTEWFADYVEERAANGHPYPYEVWDREQIRDMLGTDAFYGGFVDYREGHLHPLNLCVGEARAAHSLGARIFEQSPALRIEHGARAKVHTPNGYVEADSVLLAGNAYNLLEPKHLSNLVFPAGSYIVATEPLSEELAHSINKKDIAVCDLNEVVDYYRLSADRRLIYGGACNYSGRDPKSISAYIRPRMLKVYPQLKDVKIDYEWGGKIGIVLRRIPTVGRINGNVYYAQGYSGHGVAPTHAMSDVMVDAITGTMERFDIWANEKHFRIPGSQWVGNQIIALGMMYYKLMDQL